MPSIKKQATSASPTPAQTRRPSTFSSSILDRIADLREDKIGRLKVSIYGLPKTGKTRLGATFPKPMLVIGTEDGTASIVGTRGIKFVQLRSTEELETLIEGPIKGGQYASVMLDNGTKFRDMRVDEIWRDKGFRTAPDKKPFMYADKEWKEVWMQCSKEMRQFISPLLELPNQMDLNVIVIAHEQNFSDDTATDSDLIKPAVGSALGKSTCMWLNGECDYICQTFIRNQVVSKKIIGPNKKEIVKQVQTGKKEFCLRVGPHETYITGFRMPLGRPDVPDVIVDPSYDKIVKLIKG